LAEKMLPGAEGTHGDPQELCEFLAAVLAGFELLEEVQATFFELKSGEARREPTVGHSPILPSLTSDEINRRGLFHEVAPA
jgi:hypothetical protein